MNDFIEIETVTPHAKSEFLPASLSATPEMAARLSHFSWTQLRWLRPASVKLLVVIANHQSTDLVTSRAQLAKAANVSDRSVTRALEDLERHQLIQKADARNSSGHVSGVRIRVLRLPPTMPVAAAEHHHAELEKRAGRIAAAWDEVNRQLCELEQLMTPGQDQSRADEVR